MRFAVLASVAATASAVGPIQKVLSLLNDLKTKVAAEGEVEAEQFDAYSKWCTAEIRQADFDIETATAKSEDLNAEIEQQTAVIGQADADIAKLSGAINQNEGDLGAARKLREQENKDFRAAEKELVDTIDTLIRAASVLRKAGNEGSAGSGATLKAALTQLSGSLSVIMDAAFISSQDKSKLAALVQAGQQDDDDFAGPTGAPTAAAYESHSTSIIDVLAELKVKAEGELADARKAEMNKKHNFEMLAQSLSDQISTQNKELSKTKATKSKSAETKATASGDLSATTTKLNEDTSYRSDTKAACQTKASEWEERQVARKEEQAVIDKAIEILSGDKFTAAHGRRMPSLMQVHSTNIDVRMKVASVLQEAANRLHSVGLAQLAVRTRAGDDPFAKVKGLISGMIENLTKQAAEEADHKGWCDEENKKSKAKRDDFSHKVDDYSTRVDAAEAGIAKLKEEIAGATSDLNEMAKSLAEATNLRNKEASEYKSAMADYEESLNAVGGAISVLQEYYASKSTALVQQPIVFQGAYQSKADGASGIIGMLEVAQSDFARMEAEAKSAESNAQNAYTKMKNENEVRKATLETEVKSKEGEVARVTNLVSDLKSDRDGAQNELDAVLAYLVKLKGSCEHQPMSFQERAARRQAEIESLRQALEILENETATSLLQRK